MKNDGLSNKTTEFSSFIYIFLVQKQGTETTDSRLMYKHKVKWYWSLFPDDFNKAGVFYWSQLQERIFIFTGF